VQLKAGLEAESDVAVVFGAEVSGAAIAQLGGFRFEASGKTSTWRWAITPIRAALRIWECCPTLAGICYVGNPQRHESFEKLWGCGPIPTKPGLTARRWWKRRRREIEGAVRGWARIRWHISARRVWGAAHSSC